jgi:two-component system KDP operon response regulator KdpE
MNVVISGQDPEERDVYGFALKLAGLSLVHRPRLTDAVRRWPEEAADLLLAVQPSTDDLPFVIDRFRGQSPAPLVLLLDSPTGQLHLQCIRAGADLILSLPIEPRLVAAYCLNLIRRVAGQSPSALPVVEVEGLKLAPAARTVTLHDGEPIHLTPLEFRLLFLLLSHRGQVIPTEDLIERVWGYAETGSRDLARGLVSRLRSKLDDPAEAPRFIETIPGVGYRLRDSGD